LEEGKWVGIKELMISFDENGDEVFSETDFKKYLENKLIS